MQPKITIKQHYILLEPQEAEFWEILESLGTLFKMPEFPNKHTIWNFSEGPLKISYDDLYKLRDFIKQNEPEEIKPDKKIAIVAPTGLFSALATEYSKIVEDFPIEIKVFADLDAAEEWVTEN
jgi:hypothetical protein